MKYTLRDLLKDLEDFDPDAEITPFAENGLLFGVTNPTPIDGACGWELFTHDSPYNHIEEEDEDETC